MTTAALRMMGQSWSPRSVSGLLVWLKADAITGLSDGTAVSTWSDSSGNGYNFTGSGTNRPLYKTGIVNGRPVVRFDGTDDILASASTVNQSGTNAVTIFAVSKATAGAAEMLAEMSTNFNTVSDSWLLYRKSNNAVRFGIHGNSSYSAFETTRTLTTTFRVVVAVADTSLSAGETTAYVDGNNAGTQPLDANNTNNFGDRTVYIGARSDGTLPLNGDIAEFGIYSKALSTTERTNLQNYLGAKYAITIG